MKKKIPLYAKLTLFILIAVIAVVLISVLGRDNNKDYFKHIPEVDYSITSPVELLELLTKEKYGIYSPMSVPKDWITEDDVRELVKFVDSKKICASVVSPLSSYLPTGESTVGNEAIFLIEGFLQERYPPSLHSEVFEKKNTEWYKTKLDEALILLREKKAAKIDTPEEFIAAIGSDKTIVIEPVMIDLGKTGPLVISDVHNLTIICEASEYAEIVTNNYNAVVLTFENCSNISLINIKIGHYPESGGCYGGVVSFIDCNDISIEGCRLYGCGVNGLELVNVDGFEFKRSIIEECSMHIMCISNSKNLRFTDSVFGNNRGTELINISGCEDVLFERCYITGNEAVTDAGVLFTLDMSAFSAYVKAFERNDVDSDVTIRYSTIANNTSTSDEMVRTAQDSKAKIELEGTKTDSNSFK